MPMRGLEHGKDLTAIPCDFSRLLLPDQPSMLQDVGLIGGASVAEHSEVYATPQGPFEEIHEPRLLLPAQTVVRLIEDGDIDVAVRPEAWAERAAVENCRPEVGRTVEEDSPAGGKESIDPLVKERRRWGHGGIIEACCRKGDTYPPSDMLPSRMTDR
jgi:hypothetical protein